MFEALAKQGGPQLFFGSPSPYSNLELGSWVLEPNAKFHVRMEQLISFGKFVFVDTPCAMHRQDERRIAALVRAVAIWHCYDISE